MYYDPQLSTGECSHSLFLGCRECDECQVDEYEEELISTYEDEFAEYEAHMHKEEQKHMRKAFDSTKTKGIKLTRWDSVIMWIAEYVEKMRKKGIEIRLTKIDYLGEPFVAYGLMFAMVKDNYYWLEDSYF